VSRKLKVLHLAESPYFGGINSHICAVANAFRERGDVEIVVGTLPGKKPDRWLHTTLADRRVREVEASSAAVAALASQEKVDIVHTHNYRATILCARAKLPMPIVNTCHGQIVDRSLKLRFYQWLETRAMRRLSATIAVSDFVRAWLMGRGLRATAIRTIYNGYQPPKGAGTIPRSELGIADNAIVYLYAGRITEEKGALDFIQALRGCAGAHGVMVGDGPLRKKCESLARETKIPVYFAGIRPSVAPYYALADVVVLPSRMEALPMTLIEAAAHGKPVIANRVGGVPEIVHDFETGLLATPGDVDHLRAALLTCRDEALRAEMGAAAHARWRALFTTARMADALLDVYTEVAAKP